MTGDFKGRMPARSGEARDYLAPERQRVARRSGPAGWGVHWKGVAFWAALALVLAFVAASFIWVPDWYAARQWKARPISYDRPMGMPGMRIARFRVNPAVHRLEAYIEPIPNPPAPQGPGAWMTAAGLDGLTSVAIKVASDGTLATGADPGGPITSCAPTCVVIGGMNGLSPVALKVGADGTVATSGGQAASIVAGAPVGTFGIVCAPGDITTFCLKDEFTSNLGVTQAAGGLGELAWDQTTVASASTFVGVLGTFPNLGLLQWTTAAGQGDGSTLQLNYGVGSIVAPFGNLGANVPWDSEFIVKMSSLAATRMRVGWMNALSGCYSTLVTSINASCDGYWIRYDTSAPAAANVGNNGITRSAGGVVTVTTATHSMTLVGQTVTIAGATGCTTSPNGTFPVASIPSTTTYTFAQAGAAETCGGNAPATSTPNAATTYFIEAKSGAASPVAVAQDTAVTGVTTFVRIRIQSNVAGTIIYSLYGPTGTLLAGPTSIATDVATTNMAPSIQFVSDTSGTKVIQVDYWSFAATGLAR